MPNVSRRDVLVGMGAAVGATVVGCGGEGDVGDVDDVDVDGSVLLPEPDAGLMRSPEELLSKIDHLVVLCMENRSFDHYLGSLRLVEGRAVDGLGGHESNLSRDGVRVPVYRLNDFTPADPPHQWQDAHAQWNGGKNDGFVIRHAGPSENQVMGYHVRDQLPITHALADQSAICDRWFCSVMGGTWPNRFYLHGATSMGQKQNLPVAGFNSILSVLDDAGISNRNYYHDIAWAAGGYFKTSGLAPVEKFFEDAAEGRLPRFAIVDPMFFGRGANDDHPDHDVRLGQALIGSVARAMATSPNWGRSLLVITYDEHGGFFDHVPPPATVDERSEFRQLGFRVPTLVIGPHVKRGVVSAQLEHVSIISTLVTRFGITVLNDRVRATSDLSVCIDAASFDRPQPPPEVPAITLSLSKIRQGPEPLQRKWPLAGVPPHLDRRHESLDVLGRVLKHGERLGVVRLIA